VSKHSSRAFNPKAAPRKNPIDTERLAAICKALAHPARVVIVTYLKQIDRCVCGQLVATLPLAQSTVSQHLKILQTAGLVKGQVEGPCTCYCINHDALDELGFLLDNL